MRSHRLVFMSNGRLPLLRAIAMCMFLFFGNAWSLDAQETGIFEIRLASGARARTVLVLLNPDGEPLFPLQFTAALLEIPVTIRNDVLKLEWPPESGDTSIDLAARVVLLGGRRYDVPDQEWVRVDSEVYLSPAILERILARGAVVDWENLQLSIKGDDYPVLIRMRNEERRRGRNGWRNESEREIPYAYRSGGATASWGISGTHDGDQLRGSARAALATALFGGSLEAGTDASLGEKAAFGTSYARYTRAFPRTSWIRQMELGHVRSGGVLSRPFLGISLTNEPLYTPNHFGEVLLRPVVPAGWEYELYQGDYLLGVSKPGGGEPISAPIGYGTTPVRIRMLGPAGQERTEELVYLVPAVQVPAGEWRWDLGAGKCRTDDCALGFGDLRRGITANLTVGVGVDHLDRQRSGSRTRAHGMTSLALRPDLRLELRGRADSLAHATLQQYRRSGGWRLSGGWRREEEAPAPNDPIWFADGHAALRFSSGPSMILTGLLRGSEPGSSNHWQAGVLSGFGRFQAGVSYESGLQPDDVLSLSGRAFVQRGPGEHLGQWSLSGRLDLADREVHGAALLLTMLPSARINFTVGTTWRAESNGPEFSVAVVVRTPAAYVQTSAFASGHRSSGFVSAAGGMALGAGGFVVDPFETIDRAGARGVVFIDEDGDSLRGPEEPVLAGVPVSVGGERTSTRADGSYRVWGLDPYSVVTVSVDMMAIHRTDLSPRQPELMLRLTPNVEAVVDLPLVRTREVVGRVLWRGGAPAPGGVTVEARRDADEMPVRVLTFSDGEFYFEHLPAGEYTLTVAESSLEALGMRLDGPPPPLNVPGHPAPETVIAPTLHLRAR